VYSWERERSRLSRTRDTCNAHYGGNQWIGAQALARRGRNGSDYGVPLPQKSGILRSNLGVGTTATATSNVPVCKPDLPRTHQKHRRKHPEGSFLKLRGASPAGPCFWRTINLPSKTGSALLGAAGGVLAGPVCGLFHAVFV
jgi:hypothetical protein